MTSTCCLHHIAKKNQEKMIPMKRMMVAAELAHVAKAQVRPRLISHSPQLTISVVNFVLVIADEAESMKQTVVKVQPSLMLLLPCFLQQMMIFHQLLRQQELES